MSDSKIHRFLWIGFTDHILCNMLTIFFCLLFVEFRASLLSVNLKMHLGCSSGRIPNVFLIFLLGRVWRKCIPRSNLKGSTAVDKSIVYQYMRKIWLWPQKFTILDMQKCQYTIIMSMCNYCSLMRNSLYDETILFDQFYRKNLSELVDDLFSVCLLKCEMWLILVCTVYS